MNGTDFGKKIWIQTTHISPCDKTPIVEIIWEAQGVFANTTVKEKQGFPPSVTKAQQPEPRAGVKVLGFRGGYGGMQLLSQCLWMRSDKPLGKFETSSKHQPFFADSRLRGMFWFSQTQTRVALSTLLKDCCVPSLFSSLLGVVEPVSRELSCWVILPYHMCSQFVGLLLLSPLLLPRSLQISPG